MWPDDAVVEMRGWVQAGEVSVGVDVPGPGREMRCKGAEADDYRRRERGGIHRLQKLASPPSSLSLQFGVETVR